MSAVLDVLGIVGGLLVIGYLLGWSHDATMTERFTHWRAWHR